jgi:hypothetical protein
VKPAQHSSHSKKNKRKQTKDNQIQSVLEAHAAKSCRQVIQDMVVNVTKHFFYQNY